MNYPDIDMHIIESSYISKTNNILQFNQIELQDSKQLIQYLNSIQITENDIIDLLS